MEIIFCKQCGRRIKQDEFQNNQFTLTDGQYFCINCLPITAAVPGPGAEGPQRRKSSAQIRPKTTSQSAVVRGKTGSKLPAVEAPRPPSAYQIPTFKPKAEKKPPIAIYAGVGLAVLALIAGVAVFALSDNPPPPRSTDNGSSHGSTGNPVVRPPDHGTPVPGPGPLVNPPPGPAAGAVDQAALNALFANDVQLSVQRSLQGPRPATVCQAAAAPTLDGDLSDPCWTGAATLTQFVADDGVQTAEAAGVATTLRVIEAQGGLFFAGECQVAAGTEKMVATRVNRDDQLWSEESVEIFLLPPTARGRYAQLIVNPKGAVHDMVAVLGGERDVATNFASLKAAAKVEPNRWTFELFVSTADLLGVPAGRWRLLAGRNHLVTGGTLKSYSWTPVGGDFHNWSQWPEIEFQNAPAAEIAAAQEALVSNLPAYQAWRKTAAALAAHPLPLDNVNIPAKPRAVSLPFCPTFSDQDAGKAFDVPAGSISYFNTSASLRPAGDTGFLRFGSLTGGTLGHLHLTLRMTGGNAEQPRTFGLVVKTPPGAVRSQTGVLALATVDGQTCVYSLCRPEGSTMQFTYMDKAVLYVAPATARPLELDFSAGPEAITLFVDGKLAGVLPWPAESHPAADLVGLFTQNSGLEIYKFLATGGFAANAYELPYYGRVLAAADFAAAPGSGFGLYADPSAAMGLAIATTQTAYAAAHGGQTLAGDSDLKGNPAAEVKVTVRGKTPYRVYARIRNGGEVAGIAPKFWLQLSSLDGPEFAVFAPGQANAFLFQRLTTNGHDWGWAPLVNPATRQPVQLTFNGDLDATLRLITGTPDAALDQLVLMPAGTPLRGLEINDDSWYAGARVPPAFTLGSVQKTTLTAANDVAAAKYPNTDGPVNLVVVPPGPGPGPGPGPAPTPGGKSQSADGFVTEVNIGSMKILPAADGLAPYSDQAASRLTVPPPLVNSHFFQAGRAAWMASQGTAFSFDLKSDAMVFLALDPGQAPAKAMLTELLGDGFESSSFLIQQSAPSANLTVVRRRYPAGQVRFVGHNLAPVAPLVFVLPLDTTPRQAVDMNQPLERGPGLSPDSYVVQLHADEVAGALDAKKIATVALHRVDILPRTPLNQPAWVFHGIPASAGRTATDADSSYLTIADSPAVNRKSGALSFWLYLGGTAVTRHALVAHKIGNQTKTLEVVNRGLVSSMGDRVVRAKETLQPYKWTLIVWNFGPDGQQFIIDGKVDDLQAVPADLSAGGELRIGNDFQKDSLEGLLAEFAVHDRKIESAKPPDNLPPALKLSLAMEKIAEPGAAFIYGFDNASGLPKESDMSGNGLDGTWSNYRGTITGGQTAQIGSDRDRAVAIKQAPAGNPFLTVPPDPGLDLTSGSIFMTINLDKASLKRAANDTNRCYLISQTAGNRTANIFFGDVRTDGFFFSVLNSKPLAAPAATPAGNPGEVKANADMEGGIWYKVAFTWTPKTIRYYQNGKLIEEKPNLGFRLDGKTQSLVFFGKENDSVKSFVGIVGQLKVYNYACSVWE